MKKLTMALSLLLSCCIGDRNEKVDPECEEYLAVPGEPCHKGHWLWTMPREPAVCVCFTKGHER